MDIMRKLMMGAAQIWRTLVNTTTATPKTLLNPPMEWKVGSSYSISWTGTIPSSDSFNLFDVSTNSSSSSYCNASGFYGGLLINFWGTQIYSKKIVELPGKSIAIEVRFKIIAVSTSAPYYTADVELCINGRQESSRTCINSVSNADSFRYYKNATGIFIIKKLS